MRLRTYTGCVLMFIVMHISFTEYVVGCADSPTVVSVQIVTNADDGSWDSDTTPDPVDYDDDVNLRAVVQVSGEDYTYYWGYSSAYVDGLNVTVHEWDSDWPDPDIEWKSVMPNMTGQTPSNDPWYPAYGYYTNVVTGGGAGTVDCGCTPSYSYSRPDPAKSLGVAFGVSGVHNCTTLRGVHSRKST